MTDATPAPILKAVEDPSPIASPTGAPVEPERQESDAVYPGVTIDQMFPEAATHDFTEPEYKGRRHSLDVGGYRLVVDDFAPVALIRNGRTVLRIRMSFPGDYWAIGVGESRLLGRKSKEIYVVVSGPGGVCCTNYLIIDVARSVPRVIYDSEDFGGFRGPMEVFDSDSDGVFEIVQFDSAFRYFLDDCGSCSPEPRAVFKYDRARQTFRPAPGVRQSFIREGDSRTERWLAERSERLRTGADPAYDSEFNRALRSYVVELIWSGDERRAWNVFDRYSSNDPDRRRVREEIRRISRRSKFYRALRSSRPLGPR